MCKIIVSYPGRKNPKSEETISADLSKIFPSIEGRRDGKTLDIRFVPEWPPLVTVDGKTNEAATAIVHTEFPGWTITPDFVIKGKDADGDDYIPNYYDDLVRAVVAFRKFVKKAVSASEIVLLDNNTGEVLVNIQHGIVTHEVGFIKEI